ncbi:cache domain-containing protein, partial [bacterium]|nr:cache domain-containing protein [candidate division CSSED10-310 bacterium]
MSRHRFRFVTMTFRVSMLFLMAIPGVVGIGVAWHMSREFVLDQSDRELHHAATSILHVVRMRYDLVQNYLFQEETYLEANMNTSVDALARMARELELESARNHISDSRAKEVFQALASEAATTGDRQIFLLDETNHVLQHAMLPMGFDMGNYEWVRQMRETESGTVRYTWNYPGESEAGDRMAVFRLLHGWGWLLSVESHIPDPEKSDYADRQIQGLTDFITGYHTPSGGYAMILATEERSVITHPEISGGSIDQIPGADTLLRVRRGAV